MSLSFLSINNSSLVKSRLKYNRVKYYLVNCFLLLIPIFAWNIIFSQYLPESYTNKDIWYNVPKTLLWFENISMITLLVLTISMPLRIKTLNQRIGLLIYLVGLLVYLLVWRELILYPNGDWASGLIGFTSLAYTPLIMLFAIGLISKHSFLKIRYQRVLYITSAIVFVAFNFWHTVLVYQLAT